MQVIKFTPELMEKIRENKKTATTRLGARLYGLGTVVFENSEDPTDIIDDFEIISIGACNFDSLRLFRYHDLALHEGYDSGQELQGALVDIYGPITHEQVMTYVIFRKRDLYKEVFNFQSEKN